jgi:hypothetical protein
MFNGSKIGDLAKEIAGDLNVEKIVKENQGNPGEILKNLFSGGGGDGDSKFNIMNVVENISSKINNKISTGDLKEEDLMKEAQNMMSSMQGNSLFGNLFNQTGAAMDKDGGGMPDLSSMMNMLGGAGTGTGTGKGTGGMPDLSNMMNMLGGGGGGDGAPDLSSMMNMLSGNNTETSSNAGESSSDRNVAARQRLQKKLRNKDKK